MRHGGPAFPIVEDTETDSGYVAECRHKGMTLRDYFAAKAMVELIGMYDADDDASLVAENAYRYADAMLAAREVDT